MGKGRALARGLVEAALTGAGVSGLARSRRRGRTIILAYHNVVPAGCPVSGERSLHLDQLDFARQLDLLRRTHDVVPLAEVLEGSNAGHRPKAVITFDDACHGTVTAGVDELQRRDLPATIFVPPEFVGGRTFWWDAVRTATGRELTTDQRDHALHHLRGADVDIRTWAGPAGLTIQDVPAHQKCATEAELKAVEHAGITFGSHSWSHRNLARLESGDVAVELASSLEWLGARFSNVIPWIAYPYGFNSPAVEQAAAAAGYEGGLEIGGGWLPAPADRSARYHLPRQNIAAGVSLRGFELRVSGVLAR